MFCCSSNDSVMQSGRRVAVVLSGCGAFDGTEINEAVSVLIHLEKAGATHKVFAPDMQQDITDHHNKGAATEGHTRSVMSESARISCSAVGALDELDASEFDALIFPGGFGVMKNLSSFGTKGPQGTVRDDVAAAIKAFRAQDKPIGAICIAPSLLAVVLGSNAGGPGVKLTLGATKGDSQTLATMMGNTLVECAVADCVVDESLKVVTSPAFMYEDARLGDVFDGIGKLVTKVLELSAKK